MRPAGEINTLLVAAIERLTTPDQGPTLDELARATQVAKDKASQMLKVMKFRGRVCIPRTRRVEGRNKPVAEYALPVAQGAANDAVMGLAAAMRVWG